MTCGVGCYRGRYVVESVIGDGTWWERVSVTVCGWRVVGDGGTRGESVRESEGE